MREKIYVVTHGLEWKVECKHCNGKAITKTQSAAIGTARKHVASLPAGTLSQILIQDKGSEFRAEWTYGKDPYPPKG